MTLVSMILAGMGMVIAFIALAIAVICDLRDAGLRPRRLQRTRAASLLNQQPALRLWEPARLQKQHEAIILPINLLAAPGPDIIVGRKSSDAKAADYFRDRKAA